MSETKKKKRYGLHCLECDSKIYSMWGHDFKPCKCGAVFVDGGQEYFRCGWTPGKKYNVIDEDGNVQEGFLGE